MFFDQVPEGLPDPVFGLMHHFRQDPRPDKVDLLIGIYKDEALQTALMPTVSAIQTKGLEGDLLADYLPIDGLPLLKEGIGSLLFGSKLWAQEKERICSAQTVGGTAALRIGGEFFAHHITSHMCIPDLGWPNHPSIFERARLNMSTYPYYSRGKRIFDLAATVARLENLPENSLVLLHASCHNPTGADPTLQEWKQLSQLFQKKRLIPFFDCAYQGFGESLEQDVQSVRLFLEEGHEMAVAYSGSKNFSLYRQRLGVLFIVTQTAATKTRVESQVKRVIRALYSNPPAHGAYIAAEVLNNSSLRASWESDLTVIRSRLNQMRITLAQSLQSQLPLETFQALSSGKGMFMLLPFTPQEVQRLKEEFGIYLLENGRLSLSGLTHNNMDRVQKSLSALLRP